MKPKSTDQLGNLEFPTLAKVGNYYKELQKVYKKVDIEGANLHTLRHTFASHLIMEGVDPRTVEEYLGHSTIQVTEKYSHLSKSQKQEAIKVLSFYLRR